MPAKPHGDNGMIRALDYCCGAGGWACASRGLPIQWAAVADRDADCLETWGINHGAAHPDCQLVQGDLSTNEGLQQLIKAAGKKPVDLIVGGIPCEQVSTARGNKPLKEGEIAALHRLIDNLFELVRVLRPRWWAIEDVEAILPHLPAPLTSGVPFFSEKIDASEYGPQRRHRVFFGNYPWPIAPPEPGPRTLGDVLRPGPYRTLPNVKQYRRSRSKWYASKVMRTYENGEAGPTVTGAPGISSSNERAFMVPLVRVQDADQPSPTIGSFNGRHERAALVPMKKDEPSRTVEKDGQVRVLEWQEAAALQGFPSDFIFAASCSRTWKLVAQAIPIQVGRAILQAIAADASMTRKRKKGAAHV